MQTEHHMARMQQQQADDLADFTIPCRAAAHHKWGNGGVAEWIAWQVQCCGKRPAFGFACDPCLQQYLTTTKAARCPDCDSVFRPARRTITRFERLNKSAS